jgi:hypothetical protein
MVIEAIHKKERERHNIAFVHRPTKFHLYHMKYIITTMMLTESSHFRIKQ